MLALATDAGAPGELGSGDPGDAGNAAIRRHAVAVMDAVDRNGLVAPWTAVPHLLALATDPNRFAPIPQIYCLFLMDFRPYGVLDSYSPPAGARNRPQQVRCMPDISFPASELTAC